MEYPQVLDRFINDIRDHQLSVLRDDGLYRHLTFGRPGTNSYRFDLVTWPGYLCVSGDMGTWTFSRIPDMFEFFSENIVKGINPGYWGQKLEAGAGGGLHDFCYEFDETAFISMLDEWLSDYLCNDERDKYLDIDVIDKVSELKNLSFCTANEALIEISDYDLPGFDVYDAPSLNKFSFHYLWICYAIVWSIGRYSTNKIVDKAMSIFLGIRGATECFDYQEADNA
ncbi:MAG: hypothetical protein ACK5JN_02845 [Kluyvera sp.]|uniref:hypothetical protein n=1 Tax=Kluyvera sp. TaxID=1538228 RepID=UPI003A836E2C